MDMNQQPWTKDDVALECLGAVFIAGMIIMFFAKIINMW